MKWKVIDVDESRLASRYGLPVLPARLLTLSDVEEAQIRELLDNSAVLTTSKAACVQQCCRRILEAKQKGEKIFIGGDYDADGICSTAIMKETLDRLGIANGYYIPDRIKEGYGLHAHTVEMAAAKGYRLIITVDNGVKAHEAIAKAKELGLQIIVTDHHRIEEPVDADLVVHPDYMEDACSTLSGAGVALQISRNLIGHDDELTAMAAVAAIGDVMPLWKETRKIVKYGLSVLARRRPYSLYALLRQYAPVNDISVSFQIVPKLNSAGRLADRCNVNTLVRYLLTKDPEAVNRFAAQIEGINEMRKELSESEARKAETLCTGEPFEVIYDESFHEGLCGLVAGRLSDRLKKPVLVLAPHGELLKGSGRGIQGMDLFAFFSDFELAAFGGHDMAVGLAVKAGEYEDFRRRVIAKTEKMMPEYEEPERTAVRIRMSEISFDAIASLDLFKPYPRELAQPYFAIEDDNIVKVYDTPKVAKYLVKDSRTVLEAVLYKRKGISEPEKPVRLIGSLSLNRFKGNTVCQMEIEDIA
ncbi:MAG: DHH family phosphoesterase [Solobacterium sp.]|nr:DHH family phosphoesterase [Solobacterium sp.]